MEFVAIDVETANADMASICQIGVAKYENGLLSREWKTYVDPEDSFDCINISIHGISESVVEGAPAFKGLADTLYGFLDKTTAVCHTHFDRVAINQASKKYGIRLPDCVWLDSARVARRCWPQFARSGYGLCDVSNALGYHFRHHDALEDAKAAANILVAAIERTGIDVEGWLKRVRQPIDPKTIGSGAPLTRDANPEGPLFGEVLVFTGALDVPRREAADLAAAVGCRVESGVTKKTTLLVVGDQDIKKLAGHEKSAKHRKAEELIARGTPIRILRESDFREFVRLTGEEEGYAMVFRPCGG